MSGADRAERAWLAAVARWAAAHGVPGPVVLRDLAGSLVSGHLAPRGLAEGIEASLEPGRAGSSRAGPAPPGLPPPPEHAVGPGLLGRAYEATLAAGQRRSQGAYFTPPDLARRLVGLALGAPARGAPDLPDGPVLDPAVGGGAFLLAAADALLRRGAAPLDVLARLHGIDVDPVAVAVADVSLRWWAERRGGGWYDGPLALGVADALVEDRAWPEGGPAVVVGNPPFLGQLTGDTARRGGEVAVLRARHGPAVHGYVDTAALFLLAAARAVRPGGRVVLVQPEPVLVADHATRVRAELAAAGCLEGVWVGGAGVFAAAVRVCAPVLRPGLPQARTVATWRGRAVTAGPPIDAAQVPGRATWSAVLARVRGVPACSPRTRGRLGDLATATAGFRDQYYGLAPWVREADAGPRAGWPRLVTVGMVDPVVVRADATVRFARARWRAPVVDLDGLAASDAGLAAWVRARLVPKLVVATQSSVLEAAVDEAGCWVPSVPGVSVEAAPADLWHLAAVLNSAVATAWALERFGGAGLSPGAVKLSARQVLEVPLPAGRGAWEEAAAILRDEPGSRRSLIEANRTMLRAYGLVGADGLLSWWASRLPGHLSAAGGEILASDA